MNRVITKHFFNINRFGNISHFSVGAVFLSFFAVFIFVILPNESRPVLYKTNISASNSASNSVKIYLPPTIGGMPEVLNSADSELYKGIFAYNKLHDWNNADRLFALTKNKSLQGHILADRYLSKHYKASAAELTIWLNKYSDLPNYYDVLKLAKRIYGSSFANLPEIKRNKIALSGGDNDYPTANFRKSEHYKNWRMAIENYRQKNYLQAAEDFDAILSSADILPSWKISAAAFWSWRAHSKLNNQQRAISSLQIAAREPLNFYSMLARKQLGQTVNFQKLELTLDEDKIVTLLSYPEITRATALMQAGRSDLAESELLFLANELSPKSRHALLCLANQWSLPALQIALSGNKLDRIEFDKSEFNTAKYPIPSWQPVGGFNIDPALIYALVRQESGFKNAAISPAGASGLMQLMPGTALMMTEKIGAYRIKQASDLEKNITLGQSYVEHLFENNLIRNNMIYMLVAYNAGIMRLQEWKESADFSNDPLLFIETIPYAETRHYVMQVMTNYWIYSNILGISVPSLSALAANNWPIYG